MLDKQKAEKQQASHVKPEVKPAAASPLVASPAPTKTGLSLAEMAKAKVQPIPAPVPEQKPVEITPPNPAPAVPQKTSGLSALKAATAAVKQQVASEKPKQPAQSALKTIQAKTPKEVIAPRQEQQNAPQPEGAPVVPVEMEKLRGNLDYLAANIEQKELVGQVVRTIAIQLKESPELEAHMNDGDFNLIIRGLRRAFNVAARNKSEKKEFKRKADKEVDELSGLLGDLGIS